MEDSASIGVKSFAAVSGEEFNHVITDPGITAEQRRGLEDAGYSILVAPET
ncbi:hypothetical protein GCM10009596_32650 [Arthrobacter rhombi]|uniref:hypothetical protein n=1 Tax=Arthrobacter rhombi TaxID=71253 RepID=UPI0031DF730C